MNAINLISSGVVFNEEGHTYTKGDKQFQGVTGILERRLFPNKYEGIDEEILANAARRGTLIHRYCEIYDDMGIITEGSVETAHYASMREALGLVPIAREYIVTDGEHYASKIDAIYEGKEGGVVLNDLKTTYHLDKEYVSWQLSIYAWMFEKMNPGVKVEGLTATWLHGDDAEYVGIERKDVSLVEALIQADLADEPFDYYPDLGEVPDYIARRIAELRELDANLKAMKARQDALKAEILQRMAETHATSVKTEVATFSRVAASQKYVFDMDKFKDNHRDLYDSYCTKLQEKKESLTIRFK